MRIYAFNDRLFGREFELDDNPAQRTGPALLFQPFPLHSQGLGKLVDRPHWASGGTYTTLKTVKLPMGYQGWTMVPLTDGRETKLICLPGNPSPKGMRGKSSAHRTYAVCPDCGTHVPAGRTHQHKCKGGAA